MLELLPKIPLYHLYRRFGWPKMLPVNFTLSPSPRCNSKCITCNIWMKREDELTLDEWERVFKGLGHAPFWFTISGGEPFMFQGIVELAAMVYKYCRPAIINIPTNSLMHRIIPRKVEAICRAAPGSQVIINLSLDGVGEVHDYIRGIPGNFEKFEANYHALRELAQDLPNLNLGIHSVLSNYNIDHAPRLFDYAFSMKPDQYITEIAEQRVELDTIGVPITPPVDKYSAVIDQLIERIRSRRFSGVGKITEAFRVEYYQLVKRILREQTQVIPCFAGWASCQIYANGEVWPCCIRADNMANLRDAEAERIRTSIRNKECHCPLANASYTNLLMNPATLARVSATVARGTLEEKLAHVTGHSSPELDSPVRAA
jgi:MoaA/NifB/PqqE/SkfB family radical SAM enzyme